MIFYVYSTLINKYLKYDFINLQEVIYAYKISSYCKQI